MKRINLGIASATICILFSACATEQPSVKAASPAVATTPVEIPAADPAKAETPSTEAPTPEVAPTPAAEPEGTFDPTTISKEVFDTTKSDVQALIAKLNELIRARDYDGWVTYLGPSYRAALNDGNFLAKISGSSVLRKQGITLRELKDYFIYVVVPARANDRVDDIEFIGQNRVKAFTVDSKNRRLRLYDLEKTPSGWKIIS